MGEVSGRYRWNPLVSCRTLDGTAFVLLKSRMVSLNEVGTFIWERLEKGAELEGVVSEVVQEFETSDDTARLDAEEFVRVLIDKEMLVRC
jgi:hypothetical protein